MPETPESQPDHVFTFETFLNEAAAGDPGLNVHDLDTMQIVIMIRLRSVLTVEQLHQRAHVLITQAEEWLSEPGALRGEDGEPADPVLVEKFSDRDDLLEMMSDSTKEITDEEINELLDGEGT
jgi:hypothetical protein